MKSYTKDHNTYKQLVESFSLSDNQQATEYTTIDGLKGFKVICPMCATSRPHKCAKVFPKRVQDYNGDYPFKWFYLCKGDSSCSCSGLHSFEYFVRKYTNTI